MKFDSIVIKDNYFKEMCIDIILGMTQKKDEYLKTREAIIEKRNKFDYKKDKLFQEDELIRKIKIEDEEETKWRRVKNRKPV